MIIGSATIEITIGEAASLKGKRAILKSIINRVKAKFNVSIAEVGYNDKWQHSIIGISCVSNEKSHANSMISSVINFIDKDTRITITDQLVEIL
jgi:uncharacterized protein YlxP (DUF503 family)